MSEIEQRVLRRFADKTDPFRGISDTVNKFIGVADGMPDKLRELSTVLDAPTLGKWATLLDGRLTYLQNGLILRIREARVRSQLLLRKIHFLNRSSPDVTYKVSDLEEYKNLTGLVHATDKEFEKASIKYGIGWNLDEYLGSGSGVHKRLHRLVDAERDLDDTDNLVSVIENALSDYDTD